MIVDNKAETVRSGRENSPDFLDAELELISAVLAAFDENEVNALVILEKEGQGTCSTSNGITDAALRVFLVELFLKYPELHLVVTKFLNELMGKGEDGDELNVSIH